MPRRESRNNIKIIAATALGSIVGLAAGVFLAPHQQRAAKQAQKELEAKTATLRKLADAKAKKIKASAQEAELIK